MQHDPEVLDGQAVQIIIPNNAAFQTEDLDTYDSECDDISNAKAVLMANISNYGFDIISEVPHSETYLNNMENQSVHVMLDFEQSPVVDFTDNEIHNHNLWDIIVDGDLQEETAPTGEQPSPPAPKTAKQLTAKRNQEKVKSILLLAIPDEYLLKFHNVPDAKSLWAAIKSRFGGNDESKKMQRNVLKHQFENFTTAPNESLDKAYDRFQKLIRQLEVHAAPISKEDIN
ncbi:hypothetical protein Tco_0555355 [Tanacetum coccineum]